MGPKLFKHEQKLFHNCEKYLFSTKAYRPNSENCSIFGGPEQSVPLAQKNIKTDWNRQIFGSKKSDLLKRGQDKRADFK